MFQLQLTYKFSLKQKQNLQLLLPMLEEKLYETKLTGYELSLIDQHQRMLWKEDQEPELKMVLPGKYQVHLIFYSTDESLLKKWKKTTLTLQQTLSKPVPLRTYSTYLAALHNEMELKEQTLKTDEKIHLHIQAELSNKLKETLQLGDSLTGELSLKLRSKSSSHLSQKIEVRYLYQGQSQEPDSQAKPVITAETKLKELQLMIIKETSDQRLFLKRLHEHTFTSQQEKLTTKLYWLDEPIRRKEHLPQIVSTANKLLKTIDQKSLLLYFGKRPVEGTKHQKMVAEKTLLIDTLYRKGRALGYMELPDVLMKQKIKNPTAHNRQFLENYEQLKNWGDMSEPEYFLLQVRHFRRQQKYAEALAVLQNQIFQEPAEFWHYKKQRDLFHDSGWKNLSEEATEQLYLRFPKESEQFSDSLKLPEQP